MGVHRFSCCIAWSDRYLKPSQRGGGRGNFTRGTRRPIAIFSASRRKQGLAAASDDGLDQAELALELGSAQRRVLTGRFTSDMS